MVLLILLPISILVLYLINLSSFALKIKLLHKIKKKLIISMILKQEIFLLEEKKFQIVALKF